MKFYNEIHFFKSRQKNPYEPYKLNLKGPMNLLLYNIP